MGWELATIKTKVTKKELKKSGVKLWPSPATGQSQQIGSQHPCAQRTSRIWGEFAKARVIIYAERPSQRMEE